MGKGFLLGFVFIVAATFLALDHVMAAKSPNGRPSFISRVIGATERAAPKSDPSAVAAVADRDTVGRLSDQACDTKAGTKFCGATTN